jgi:hypothetical protein
MIDPSPFLPGTFIQYAWDSTSLGYLKTCPRLYYYHMICGYVAKDESIHLRFGREYHSAIQDFENLRADGHSFDDAVRETVRQLLIRIADWDPDITLKAGQYKNPRTLVQLVVDYVDNYRNDAAKTIILENGKPAVELSFKFDLDFGPTSQYQPVHERDWDAAEVAEKHNAEARMYMLCGHLDRVVDINENLFVVDHKTTVSTISDYWFKGFNPSNQMTLYTFAGQVVMGLEIKGVCIEGAQIGLEKFTTKFARAFTYRNDELIDEWLDDLEYHLNAAEAFAEAKHWPMNDTSCDKFGGCRFRDVCAKSPNVRDVYLKSDFIQLPVEERWNPLKSR